MREVQCYQLPVAILIETMSGLYATVALHAPVPSLPEGWNKPCQADLTMVQGLLHTCTITTMDGLLLLQQKAALQMLERLGRLEWTLHVSFPSEQHQTPQMHSSGDAEPVSWKVTPPVVPAVPGTLPHRQKQALLLLESQKCSEEIARLLELPLPHVEGILYKLKQQYLIDERGRSR